VIVPPNPFTAVSEIVETDEDPGATADGEVALTLKSWKLKIAEAVWIRLPLAPLTTRTYVPATLELHETVAVPEVAILVGLMDPQVKPEGRLPSVRVIVPVNPFWAAVVIVELADWPALTPDGELAVMVKSGAGGPRLRNFSKQPQPIGELAHCIAP
jgi:hypothetical protein